MSSGLARIFEPGRDAVVKNWRPFLAIQAACVVVVASYYAFAPVREAGSVLARWKFQGGLPFAAVSVAFAAVILPELARRLTRSPRDRPLTLADLVFQLGYFSFLGILLDLLYTVLARIVGAEPSLEVVLIKLTIDLTIFSALISMPLAVLLFAWRDADFSYAEARRILGGGGFLRRYSPVLVTCWAFWLPVLICLYSLPFGLQFVFSVLAEAAWCLLLVSTASRLPEEDKTVP